MNGETKAAMLAGRCRSGSEPGGTRLHVVPDWKPGGMNVAICGAKPGRTSAGWSSWPESIENANCPRCLKALKRKEDLQ